MLEVTGDDIAALGDEDLRALVARLCEAEMRKRGLPASAVTWGGAQEAADGGIDVRVGFAASTVFDGFIPRAASGFQVKKADIPPAEITVEMRPGGAIRLSIQKLADEGGAYIIVSGNGSTSDDALHRRREAMSAAVGDIANGDRLALDFYDRTRLATWLRDHPGLVPWARQRAGRAIRGWHSYGAWANPAQGVSEEYLSDDAPRVRMGATDADQGIAALDGVQRLRDRLRQARNSARLVGLSGVGKTRLAQALFDERIGRGALASDLALYTNLGDGPEPSPVAMVSHLVTEGTRAIVIVDNCPPDLHRRLTELVGAANSQLSLLTIEYDIREDQPEGTQVFEMEPSSLAMTQKLLRRRFRGLSEVDAERIADFSGGNARMAIALAGTVQQGESVSGLADDELFRRLFHQNHAPDADLMRAAEACSLLYSFDGEDTSEAGELARLGRLADQGAVTLYGRVAELRRRDLVQARSKWRAVLPHAVSNRLAKRALQDLPLAAIERQLVREAPERLKRSFSRRLGYLHDSADARRFVTDWLSTNGMLGDPAELDDVHVDILVNVAPVAPDAALAALERASAGPNAEQLAARSEKFVRLLRLLAYDAALFERCAELLARFAVHDRDAGKTPAARALTSLFFIYLSGTHATVSQRVRIMESLVRSDDPTRQSLGLEVLGHLLQTSHFTSSYDFQFGARHRDYGYHPDFAGARAWFGSILGSAEALGLTELPIAAAVRRTVGNSFRGLWADAELYDDLERVAGAWSRQAYWRDGWIGARTTLHYAGAAMAPAARQRLVALEQRLRPANLEEKVRSIVLSKDQGVDLDEYEEDDTDAVRAYERAEAVAEELGEEVAVDERSFDALLPDLTTGAGRLLSFGAGLAKRSAAPAAMWRAMVAAYEAAPANLRGPQLLGAFLRKLAEIDAEAAAQMLDQAVEHPALAAIFPVLQCAVPIDARGVGRLRRCLAIGTAPIGEFAFIAWGRAHETIPATDLADLVERIIAKPDGSRVGLAIVFFRFHSDQQANRSHEHEVIAVGRTLLGQITFGHQDQHRDHRLGLVVVACLGGSGGETGAASLCARLRDAARARETLIWHHHDLLQALCKVQPIAVLETLFGVDEPLRTRTVQMIGGIAEKRRNPFDAIPVSEMLEWCEREAVTRYTTMASVISYLRGSEEEAASQWSDAALALLNNAPDPVAVALVFAGRFRPGSWSGSRADIMEGRTSLLAELERHPNARLAQFAREEGVRLARDIEFERRREAAEERLIDERFE